MQFSIPCTVTRLDDSTWKSAFTAFASLFCAAAVRCVDLAPRPLWGQATRYLNEAGVEYSRPMARLVFSILLSLPVLTFTAKTHITVKTVKEELNIQNVEHPSDGVIVRIIDPPQDDEHEEEHGHEAEEAADAHDAHGDDHGHGEEHGEHGVAEHGSHGDEHEHGEHGEHAAHGEHGEHAEGHGHEGWEWKIQPKEPKIKMHRLHRSS